MNEQFFSKKYQVKREIASGGMGTIYLASDTKLGRDVAIKMLHPQYSGEPAFAQRFLQEARAMAQLDHPNIIRIWSVEEEKTSHYIVMEYFPGIDLKQIMRTRGPISITEALLLSTQIIQGLDYAHSMGIIHRDIKPANILVDQEGTVKITDFGIAAARNASSLTVEGTVIGTPEYMAPEQARAEPVGPHTDLYSAGIVLYELVTGQTPYKGMPAHSVVAKLAYSPDTTPLTFPPHFPAELKNLITNMTKKQVEDRLKDIKAISTVLKTDFSLTQVLQDDTDKTLLLKTEESSRQSEGHFSQTVVQQQPIPTKIQPGTLSDTSSNQPPPQEDLRTQIKGPNPASPPTRKPIIPAIGILTFLVILVLVWYQWPVDDHLPSPLPSPSETTQHMGFQDTVETTIEKIQEISQDIQVVQKEMTNEFKSLSSDIQSLHREITDNTIPLSQPDAQQWFDKTQEKVTALVRDSRELENSQKALIDKNMKASTASLQQGEHLLQEDLSQDQQKQLRAAKDNLEKSQKTLQTTYANHRQNTQSLLSNLDSEIQKLRQTLFALTNQQSEDVTPLIASPNIERQLVKLQNEINSLDQEVGGMLKSFEASTINFTTQLSSLQTGIKQIKNDVSFDPTNTQKLESLKEKFQTFQQESQAVLSEQQANKNQLEANLQMAMSTHQRISGRSLDTAQKVQLGKLNNILKNNQTRLKAFPPDSWRQLQDLSRNIQVLSSTTEQVLVQNTQKFTAKEQEIKNLSQKASLLATSTQELHSQTSSQYRLLTQQIANDATQIALLESHPLDETFEKTVAKLEKSLGSLKETLPQHSAKYTQQFPTFAKGQTEIQEQLNTLTSSPLVPPLDQQASQVQQTLTSIQQNLQDLKQLNWKALSIKLDTTLLAFAQTKEAFTQEIPSEDPHVPPPIIVNRQSSNNLQSLKRVLNDFTIAYENRDILRLKLTTSMSESRARNLDLMFKIYTVIDTHVEIVSTSESQAKAKFVIDKLINKAGKTITPNSIIRETTITIPKKDGEWGKIQW